MQIDNLNLHKLILKCLVEQQDVIKCVEGLIVDTFKAAGVEVKPPFIQMPWQEAMDRFGSDKPDTRFGLELFDIGDIILQSEFKIVRDTLENGGIVRGIRIPGGAKFSRKDIDDITKLAVSFGAKALANIIYNEDGTAKSPVLKFVTEEQAQAIKDRAGAENGDIIFFVADKPKLVYDIMGRLRLYFGKRLDLIDESKHNLLWVVDFPMFELDEHDKLAFSHNPFSMPQGGLKALEEQNPLEILAYQYDIVCNGIELSSGAVRNHDIQIMLKAFEMAGYTEEEVKTKFGALYTAFQFGAPPHAGIAPGIDRMLMLLSNSETIREVIAFPLNSKAQDLMMGAPGNVRREQLRDVHIEIIKK